MTPDQIQNYFMYALYQSVTAENPNPTLQDAFSFLAGLLFNGVPLLEPDVDAALKQQNTLALQQQLVDLQARIDQINQELKK